MNTQTEYKRAGLRTVTAYTVVRDAAALIAFLKDVFGAEEKFRGTGGASGIHAEVLIGDSMLMLGGGGPDIPWQGEAWPMAFHITAADTDAAYYRGLQAGAASLSEPLDQPWGERTASLIDPFGNRWYIGTRQVPGQLAQVPSIQPYLHPVKARPLIDYAARAFGARQLTRYDTPDGTFVHATLGIGDATIEITEAGVTGTATGTFYVYVPDAGAAYRQAMDAGGTSLYEPVDQPYGERVGGVADPFGNRWYLATVFRNQS
jgi:uncharacterized glyoxalase superfamily protein PhnB